MLNFIKRFFKGTPEPEQPQDQVMICHIVDGPIERDEFDERSLYNAGVLPELRWCLYANVIYEGEYSTEPLWFETLEEVEVIVNHFKTSINPIIMEF